MKIINEFKLSFFYSMSVTEFIAGLPCFYTHYADVANVYDGIVNRSVALRDKLCTYEMSLDEYFQQYCP